MPARPIRAPGLAALAASVLFLAAGALAAQEPRTVSGVVVDAGSGAAVADVLVTVERTALQAITDADGHFTLVGVPLGTARLGFRHLAYGEHYRTLPVGATGALDFLIRISTQAIELEPLVVAVMSDEERERRASGSPNREIGRAAIERASNSGQSLIDLLRREVQGIRVRGECVEFRRQGLPDVECLEPTLILDGVRVQQSGILIQTLQLDGLARIRVLSPAEAGVQYGDAGAGVILIDTERGAVPEARGSRVNVTGFEWSESEPYPWVRVVGASLVGNAAAIGLAYVSLERCLGERTDSFGLLPPKCGTMMATGAGFMTGMAASLVAHWAGGTARTEGRMIPIAAVGILSSATGYMLVLNGENNGSDASRIAGLAVLSVATPLLLTLSDRVFRVLR